jgi:hypothetical protein
MSGSPKYTTVSFEAQRRAELEALRRQREAERQARQEEARRRRIAAAAAAAQRRAQAAATQLAQLRASSAGLTQEDAVRAAAARVAVLAAQVPGTADEAGLQRLDRALRDAEREADGLAADVARELTQRAHATALDVIAGQLAAIADRGIHDPEGHRGVAALAEQARRRIGDQARFEAAHRELAGAVAAHLEKVRDRLAVLRGLTERSEELTGRLRAVLDEAGQAGIDLPEAAELRAELGALAEESDGRHVSRWQHRLAALQRGADAVTATVDARLDQLERIGLIVEAATAALPAAGLRVVPDSLDERAGAVSFAAQRPDGTVVELTVHAGDGRGSLVEYRTDADDTVVRHTAEGEVRTCDLTEELLEQFHTELGRQGVHADGLHWAGRPERPRAPLSTARPMTAERPGATERGRA